MELMPVAMVISATSLRYVMNILLYFIKAYDPAQRDELMNMCEEEYSIEIPGMMATTLQPSTAMTTGYARK